ncbi:MAG: hypothetical protein UY16_C0023G0009 [Candidatus Gottesmanbacteria bacterium GW2011_GWA2_47_9]|uniref:Uncharacterized protein n=1 Tax=Candidatus Gottesmanbacteria bacterium GW2011_GWA2_47_9 TaxID=1618445 RepID=A0A0G1WB84_9BACT|nr:MAG: hypothetical protein UY16_C0023G0009 [Candidatus Gottesmanbacteria bacterium GW2011_GWA2_47_9]
METTRQSVRSIPVEDIPPQDMIPLGDGDTILIFDYRWAVDPLTGKPVPLYRKESQPKQNPWPHKDPLLNIA